MKGISGKYTQGHSVLGDELPFSSQAAPRTEYPGYFCRFVWMTWLTVSVFCLDMAFASGYRMEGLLVFKVETSQLTAQMPTNLASQISLPFNVAARHGAWRVEMDYPNGIREIAGSDGNDVYSVIMNRAEIVNGRVVGGKNPETLVLHHTLFAWLATASGTFFETGATPTRPPWLLAGTNPPAVFQYEVQFDWQSPRLPREFRIIELHPAKRLADTVNRLSGLNDGMTVGEYEVIQWTNVGGLRLPIHFNFKRYLAYDGLSGLESQRLHYETFSGFVTNVSADVETVPRPALAPGAAVYDLRFARPELGVESVAYVASNGNWLSAEDAQLQQAARRVHEAAARAMKNRWWESVMINAFTVGFFVLISALVTAVIWRLRRGRVNQKVE